MALRHLSGLVWLTPLAGCDAKGTLQLALKKSNLQYRLGCPVKLRIMLHPLYEEAEDQDLYPNMAEFV